MSGISPVPVFNAAPEDDASEGSPPVPPQANDDARTPYSPPDFKTWFLGGIFTLMLLTACMVAAEILIPFVAAFFIKMALYPVMRWFERIHLPRMAAALLVIALLLGAGTAIGSAIASPAVEWAQDLPKEFPKLRERLHELRNPIAPLQRVLNDAQNLTVDTRPGQTAIVAVREQGFAERFMTGTQNAVFGFAETLVILFFLLVSGDTFLRRLVEVLPRFRDKKHAINISNQIESDISAYLLTITCMNAIVGVATGLIMHFTGIGDPILWGMVAFLLNYLPIVGPIIGIVLFAMVGMISEDVGLAPAVLPAGLYLAAHVLESQFITPFLLARHFTINPVLVILGLVFFYWMWGIPGAILSMPILAMVKVVCDNIDTLKPFGHFIEG